MIKKLNCPFCQNEIKFNIGYNVTDSVQYQQQCSECKNYIQYFTPIDVHIEAFKTGTELDSAMAEYAKKVREESK